tara:strand:+ start:743 stop:865 length:123 start_codon:yes stop_codon:yes gene_type:complete
METLWNGTFVEKAKALEKMGPVAPLMRSKACGKKRALSAL